MRIHSPALKAVLRIRNCLIIRIPDPTFRWDFDLGLLASFLVTHKYYYRGTYEDSDPKQWKI